MLVLTTDTLPAHIKIESIYGLVEITGSISLSATLFGSSQRNEEQEVYDRFIEFARPHGNLIFGVKVSTAIANFSNGVFLYKTYQGTVATVEIGEPD